MSALSPATNPLTQALSAAENGLNTVSSTVSGAASSLPFFNGSSGIGALITNGLAGVGNFLKTISTDLQNLTANDPTPTDQQVSTKLYNSLGTSILGDTGNGMVSSNKAQDYVVVTHPLHDTDGSQSVEIELYLTATISGSVSLPSKNLFELPGLPINVSASVGLTYKLGFNYELAFGYNPSAPDNKNGFFIDTSKVLSDYHKTFDGTALPAHQMMVTASAGLTSDSQIAANLGAFQAFVSDNTSNPTNATLALDVDGLGLSPGNITPTLAGTIGIHLKAKAGLGPYQNNTFQYLSVAVDVNVDWSFSTSTAAQGPTVSFDNITLALGPAVGQFVTPIITDIQDVLAPLEPIIKVLTEPIPGLSDLSHLAGQGDVTLLQLAKDAASLHAFGPGFDQVVSFISDIVPVLNDLEKFKTNGDNLFLNVGDFTLPKSDTQGLLDNNYLDDFANGSAPSIPLNLNAASTNPAIQNIQDVINQVPGLSGVEQSALQALQMEMGGGDGISINFPILDNPTSVLFPLLLNQGNANFVTFDAHLSLSFPNVNEDLPSIFGLSLSLMVAIQFDRQCRRRVRHPGHSRHDQRRVCPEQTAERFPRRFLRFHGQHRHVLRRVWRVGRGVHRPVLGRGQRRHLHRRWHASRECRASRADHRDPGRR